MFALFLLTGKTRNRLVWIFTLWNGRCSQGQRVCLMHHEMVFEATICVYRTFADALHLR